METLAHIIETFVYFCLSISVMYLLIFSLAAKFKRRRHFRKSTKKHRYAVLFPAYKEDRVIVASVKHFLRQTYPKACYDIVVISDQMKEETDNALIGSGVIVLKANYRNSSKAKALQLAVDTLDENRYDAVVIMDGDNIVEPDFLDMINDAFDEGEQAIQTHRTVKNATTSTALLDAVSEEINNTIFRKGHVALGLSSALIGSGMIFSYRWFKENIHKANTAGEDKELEALLLRQGIYTGYLDEVKVYDEKVSSSNAFYNQRRRWLASNIGILKQTLPDFTKALAAGNWSYCDKIIQWMIPPRVLLLGAITLLAFGTTIYDIGMSIKWWILLIILGMTLLAGIPKSLMGKQLFLAAFKIPWLGTLMFINLFRLKGVNKKFIHTDHGE